MTSRSVMSTRFCYHEIKKATHAPSCSNKRSRGVLQGLSKGAQRTEVLYLQWLGEGGYFYLTRQ